MPIYNVTIDDVSPFFTYDGAWIDANPSDPTIRNNYNSTFHSTSTPGGSVSFSFNGTGVYLYGAKRTNHDIYSVTINGITVATQNGNSGGIDHDVWQFLLYGNGNLPYDLYHVVLANSKDPSFWVDFDFAIITTGDGKYNTSTQDLTVDDSQFIYDDNWVNNSNDPLLAEYYHGTNHRTTTPHAIARIPFNGNGIKLYSTTSNDHGEFTISLDGGPARTLNGTAPSFRPNTLLYQLDGLSDGDHNLIVENLSSQRLDLDQAIVSTYVLGDAHVSSASVATTSGSVGSYSSPTSANVSVHSKQENMAVIVGSVIGVLVLALLALSGYLFFLRYRRARFQISEDVNRNPRVPTRDASSASNLITQVPGAPTSHMNDPFELPPSYYIDVGTPLPSSIYGVTSPSLSPSSAHNSTQVSYIPRKRLRGY